MAEKRKTIKTVQVRVQDLAPGDVMLYGTGRSKVWREVKEVKPIEKRRSNPPLVTESCVSFTDGWPGTYRNLDLVTVQHEVQA